MKENGSGNDWVEFVTFDEYPDGRHAYDFENENLFLCRTIGPPLNSGMEVTRLDLPLDEALGYALLRGATPLPPKLRVPVSSRERFEDHESAVNFTREVLAHVVPFSRDGLIEAWSIKNRDQLLEEVKAVPREYVAFGLDEETVYAELRKTEPAVAARLTDRDMEKVTEKTLDAAAAWCSKLDNGLWDEVRDAALDAAKEILEERSGRDARG